VAGRPSKLLAPEYPDRFEVRYVSANGGIRWHKKWVNVSSVLIGEYVGLGAVRGKIQGGRYKAAFSDWRPFEGKYGNERE
jgi:hypothetical protein